MTDRHDITVILLTVALTTITVTPSLCVLGFDTHRISRLIAANRILLDVSLSPKRFKKKRYNNHLLLIRLRRKLDKKV
jgi:hypothetical protein